MATVGTALPTLADWAKLHSETGDMTQRVAEYMATTNETIIDIPWQPGNLATGDMVALRTQLPTATTTRVNQYVGSSHSGYQTEINSTARIESWLDVDASLVELSDNPMQFLWNESLGHQQAQTQELSRLLFNGSAAIETEFKGLYARYNALDADGPYTVLSAGADSDTDLTSIWLITWGADTCYGIYPKNSKAGLQIIDHGKVVNQLTASSAVTNLEVYKQHFLWNCGISIKDPRYVVRGCNIDVSELATASPQDLILLMIRMIEAVPSQQALTQVVNPEAARGPLPRASFYMNKTVRTWLRNQIRTETNVDLSIDTVAGQRVLTFDGIPVRVDAAITNAETVVT